MSYTIDYRHVYDPELSRHLWLAFQFPQTFSFQFYPNISFFFHHEKSIFSSRWKPTLWQFNIAMENQHFLAVKTHYFNDHVQ